MLSVILVRSEEPTVVQLTQENLQKELKALNGAELLVTDSWEEGIKKAKNNFICLVEPDCLVSSGYFASNVGLFLKNNQFRKLSMISSAVGLNNWANRIYGYELQRKWGGTDIKVGDMRIQPARNKKSTNLFSIQAGFVPGAIIRKSAADNILNHFKRLPMRDLVKLSTDVSFFLWGSGRRIQVNPNSTYISTRKDLDNAERFTWNFDKSSLSIFEKEMI